MEKLEQPYRGRQRNGIDSGKCLHNDGLISFRSAAEEFDRSVWYVRRQGHTGAIRLGRGAPAMTMGSAAIAEQFGLFLSNIHLESEAYR
jgi:hypothetical protein